MSEQTIQKRKFTKVEKGLIVAVALLLLLLLLLGGLVKKTMVTESNMGDAIAKLVASKPEIFKPICDVCSGKIKAYPDKCWDLNGNGKEDPEEDMPPGMGDGTIDKKDCEIRERLMKMLAPAQPAAPVPTAGSAAPVIDQAAIDKAVAEAAAKAAAEKAAADAAAKAAAATKPAAGKPAAGKPAAVAPAAASAAPAAGAAPAAAPAASAATPAAPAAGGDDDFIGGPVQVRVQ